MSKINVWYCADTDDIFTSEEWSVEDNFYLLKNPKFGGLMLFKVFLNRRSSNWVLLGDL